MAGESETAADSDPDEGTVRRFSSADTEVAFPLGGIGTGNVSLGARGELRDWEIFNRPGKGTELPYSFFAIHCEGDRTEGITRVLESDLQPPHSRSGGYPPDSTAGLPRLDETEFRGEYPVASVAFRDSELPVDVTLTSFTPFVPLNPRDSGIPVAVLEYEVENPTTDPLSVSVAGSLANPVGHRADLEPGGHRNEFHQGEHVSGIEYESEQFDADAVGYGEATLATPATEGVSHTASWERSGWWDAFRAFTRDFSADGRLTPNEYEKPSEEGDTDVGSLAVTSEVRPGESETVTFLVSWYVPNRPHGWDQSLSAAGTGGDCCAGDESRSSSETIRNEYATRFDGAWDVAEYVAAEFPRLRGATVDFRDAFFESTLPGHVLEAVSSQIAVLRSNTCMWFEDGAFLGYEGCTPDAGCCHGNCTHVWNYAWTVAALFPSLEREMRRIDFEESTADDGYMAYRTDLPFGDPPSSPDHGTPAADGQMGTVMRLYREWTRSGDDEFLERLWPRAKAALEFAFEYDDWDPDEDGVMTGAQHNTYDIEFHGPNPLSQTWYLGALRAGVEMARAVGDEAVAERYEAVIEAGSTATDDRLWNGEFYVQEIDDVDARRYQLGDGCLSDQLLGQWYSTRLDLGYLLPEGHVERTLDSILEYNFRSDFSDHFNHQRTYALNDERGLVLCSWPDGDEPAYPFVYSDEVWTGIEYQVASHLVEEGRVDAGLGIVRAVRDRHDGVKRNPWNEFECGNHYARAMSSWAVYESLCGLSVDLTGRRDDIGERGFSVEPAVDTDDFRCFWITGDEWGTYEREGDEETVETLYRRDE